MALGVLGLSLVAFGYTLNDLAHGITEVPGHWWSTLPVLSGVAAAVVWLAAGGREQLRLPGGRRSP